MQVTIRFEAQLREAAQTDEISLDTEQVTIEGLLQELTAQFPEPLASRLLNSQGQIQRSLLVFVNDQSVSTQDLESWVLNNGDVVSLYPPIAGG